MNYKLYDHERRMKCAMNSLRKSNLSDRNKKIIIDFVDDCQIMGISKSRLSKYIYLLIKMGNWLNEDYDSINLPEVKSLVREIEQCPLVEYTKAEMKMILKKIIKWIKNSDDFPPEVKWIMPHLRTTNTIKMPEELLTEKDIELMIRAATKDRDRALISVLYESGCRIGELMHMKIRHIAFDQYGAKISVDGKTGPRRIRLVSSVPFIQAWINSHPKGYDPESYIWVKTNSIPVKYGRISTILKEIAKNAGLKKRVFPHLFRHSRATFLANHLTEAQMKEYFGWTQASKMAAIYVHLSGRDVDDAILKVYGKTRPEKSKETDHNPNICERCDTQNPFTNIYCAKCGQPLGESTRMRLIKEECDREKCDNLLDEMLQDQEFKEVFLRKIRSMA